MRKYGVWAAQDEQHVVNQMNNLESTHYKFRVESIAPIKIGPARFFLFYSFKEKPVAPEPAFYEDDAWNPNTWSYDDDPTSKYQQDYSW